MHRWLLRHFPHHQPDQPGCRGLSGEAESRGKNDRKQDRERHCNFYAGKQARQPDYMYQLSSYEQLMTNNDDALNSRQSCL